MGPALQRALPTGESQWKVDIEVFFLHRRFWFCLLQHILYMHVFMYVYTLYVFIHGRCVQASWNPNVKPVIYSWAFLSFQIMWTLTVCDLAECDPTCADKQMEHVHTMSELRGNTLMLWVVVLCFRLLVMLGNEELLKPPYSIENQAHRRTVLAELDRIKALGIKPPQNLWEYKVRPLICVCNCLDLVHKLLLVCSAVHCI